MAIFNGEIAELESDDEHPPDKDKPAEYSSTSPAVHYPLRINTSEEQPLRQCWGPGNLSDIGLIISAFSIS